MIRRQLAAACVLFLALATGSTALAQPGGPATLKVGDPAPPVTLKQWVKGDPVPTLKKGQAYIVEFWATWCGPCRQTIPHLTDLQAKYPKNKLTIIGVSSGEKKGIADVTPYVEKMGAKMAYTVAFDETGEMNAAWMQAADQKGIPTAFLVDQKGRLAWIGHPLDGLDGVVEQVVAGTYDVDAALALQVKIDAAQKKLGEAGSAGDTMGVVRALDNLMEIDKARFEQYAIKKFEILLFIAKSYDAGYAWGAELVDLHLKDRGEILSAIAVAIVDAPGLERRDLALAERSAARANTLGAGNEPRALDALARVHFALGHVEKAVELQKGAVDKATDEKMKQEMQTRLTQFQAKG